MTTIRNFISKPSEAVNAMLTGLNHYDEAPWFDIDMGTYGASYGVSKDDICFGCAATCALQQITSKDFTPTTIRTTETRAAALGLTVQDLAHFEGVINHLRLGEVKPLFNYFGIKRVPKKLQDPGFSLLTQNWKEEFNKVQAYVELLEKEGY